MRLQRAERHVPLFPIYILIFVGISLSGNIIRGLPVSAGNGCFSLMARAGSLHPGGLVRAPIEDGIYC